MTIVNSGRNRMATLAESTWMWIGVGTGTTTSDIGDTDLETILSVRRVISQVDASANVVYFKHLFNKSENNTTGSNVTEIIIADASTAGAILFHTIASTNTWTSYAKSSATQVTISTSLTVSS